jgi:hypothetical protein
MQNDSVMELVTSFMREKNDITTKTVSFGLFGLNIAPVESTALFEFLSYSNNMQMIHIMNCTMQKFACHELAKLLIQDNEVIKLGNCKLTELSIIECRLTDEDLRHLS